MRLVIVSLRRVVVPLLALIGFAFAPAATAGLEKQAPAAPSYTYASFGHATHEVHAAAERGPPTAYDHTFTYDAAVERWTRGASSRADTATPPFAGTIYDDSATLEQVAGAAPTTERPAQGAWAPLSLPARSGVAAKTESHVLSKVDDLPCNCFVAGTMVKAAGGEKPIEDVEVGDKVWARDLATGKNELRTVTGLFHKHADQVMTITVADGAKVTVTEEHPFYVAGLGWVMSGDLEVGDHLAQRNGGFTTITAIGVRPADTTVYNFTVEGDHNYYVTEAQLLVHNCDLGASIAGHMGSRRLADVHGSTEAYIESVIHGDAPLTQMRSIGQSGRAIWRDGRNIIIRDPMSVDGGTAFSKPSVDAAIRYFDNFE